MNTIRTQVTATQVTATQNLTPHWGLIHVEDPNPWSRRLTKFGVNDNFQASLVLVV